LGGVLEGIIATLRGEHDVNGGTGGVGILYDMVIGEDVAVLAYHEAGTGDAALNLHAPDVAGGYLTGDTNDLLEREVIVDVSAAHLTAVAVRHSGTAGGRGRFLSERRGRR